jgi:tetratricopeptide (TPR) repeat protein
MSRLANALASQGRKRDALRVWRALFVGQRNKASLYFQRANWAMIDRKFCEAEKYLRLCLLRDDGYFRETAHFWRAEALAQLGRVSSARRELEFVSSEYYELWFFGRKRWSKADLLAQLTAAQ